MWKQYNPKTIAKFGAFCAYMIGKLCYFVGFDISTQIVLTGFYAKKILNTTFYFFLCIIISSCFCHIPSSVHTEDDNGQVPSFNPMNLAASPLFHGPKSGY